MLFCYVGKYTSCHEHWRCFIYVNPQYFPCKPSLLLLLSFKTKVKFAIKQHWECSISVLYHLEIVEFCVNWSALGMVFIAHSSPHAVHHAIYFPLRLTFNMFKRGGEKTHKGVSVMHSCFQSNFIINSCPAKLVWTLLTEIVVFFAKAYFGICLLGQCEVPLMFTSLAQGNTLDSMSYGYLS